MTFSLSLSPYFIVFVEIVCDFGLLSNEQTDLFK